MKIVYTFDNYKFPELVIKERTLSFREWNKPEINILVKLLDEHKIDTIEYNCIEEPHPLPEFHPDNYHYLLFQKIKENQILLKVTLSCKINEYKNQEWFPEKNDFVEFRYNPYYFIFPTVKYCNKNHENISKKNYFTILSNLPHKHRCLFIDLIHKEKLNLSTFFTWNNKQKENLEGKYKFKYWNEKKVISETPYSSLAGTDRYKAQHSNLPVEYHESLFEIVLETTTNCTFFSEKTWKPIYLEKPFLIFGGPFSHKKLTDLGFILHHFIDYSFDYEEDDTKRAKKIIVEMKKLLNFTKQELIEKTKTVNIYNYNRLIEIYENQKQSFSEHFPQQFFNKTLI